jgi:hypothetical protein
LFKHNLLIWFWQHNYGSNFHLILTLSSNFLYTVCVHSFHIF